MPAIRDKIFGHDFPVGPSFKFMKGRLLSAPAPGEEAKDAAEKLKASRIRRLSHTFKLAAAGPYAEALKQHYQERGLIDLSALHFERAAWAHYNRKYNGGRLAVLPPLIIDAALDPSDAKIFQAVINGSAAGLSDSVRQLMAESGVRTRLARRLADVDPAFASQPVTKGGLTKEFMTGAYYESDERRVTMLWEYPDPRHKESYVSLLENVGVYYLHECGHAIDDVMGDPSKRDGFSIAYEKDLERLKKIKSWKHPFLAQEIKRKRGYLNHYLPKIHGGSHLFPAGAKVETFAELFSERAAGSILQRIFRESRRQLEKILAALDYEMSTAPPRLIQ